MQAAFSYVIVIEILPEEMSNIYKQRVSSHSNGLSAIKNVYCNSKLTLTFVLKTLDIEMAPNPSTCLSFIVFKEQVCYQISWLSSH